MGAEPFFDRQMLESALEWWRDAGVDTLVEDAPRDWFAKPETPPLSAIEPAGTGDLPPEIWEQFVAWRSGPATPEAAWLGASVLASGPADATAMVLCDVPAREDCAAGALLTGEAGRLFDRMLAAVGLDRRTVHLASVCVRRPTGGRVSSADQVRLAGIARHHVGIIAPKRLLLMGDAASRAVLGMSVLDARGRPHPIAHRSGSADAVATFHPRFLLENPGRKRDAWADLLLFIRGSGE